MAYSKQNFQDGQILNAANLEKMENGIIAGQGAHNLLDNSDFTNPVNQRGAKTATLGKYFIDRWSTEPFPSGPSITIDSNGLTLLPTTSSTAGIYQQLPDYENRKGKVHTFAICVDNVWKCVSFTMGNFGVGYFIHGLAFFSVDNRNILIRNNASDTPVPVTIQRVALYEGSYTTETLPSYVPKGKHVEMLNCGVPLAPHNLLDNSDFRNPVNQRGKTSWTNWNNYTVDRWIFRNNPVSEASIGVSGMSITTGSSEIYFEQAFDKSAKQFYIGKPLTLVFSTNEGLLIKKWTVVDGSYSRESIGNFQMTIGCLTNFWIDFAVPANKTINIYWAALYEGSYDVSTLPAYVPKGYAAELAECQRYYQQYNIEEMSAVGNYENGNTYIRCQLSTPMRIAPSLVQSSVNMWTTYNSVDSMTQAFIFYKASPQTVNLKCANSYGSNCQLVIAINNAVMGFSADL